MVIDFKSQRVIPGNGNGASAVSDGTAQEILRPSRISITNPCFSDEVPDKKKSAADPLKNMDDIDAVSGWLVDHKRYRDNLIFVSGINFGLRCGDLLHLKVGHLVDENGNYRKSFEILEQKTSETRGTKTPRVIYMNDAVADAADLYLTCRGSVDRNDWLFPAEGNRGKNSGNPISVRSVERILKEVINDELSIPVHAGTHLLRKTFAYHTIMNAPDRSRAIEFLQKIFGHGNQLITLMYAGITDEEVSNVYGALNLGRCKQRRSKSLA